MKDRSDIREDGSRVKEDGTIESSAARHHREAREKAWSEQWSEMQLRAQVEIAQADAMLKQHNLLPLEEQIIDAQREATNNRTRENCQKITNEDISDRFQRAIEEGRKRQQEQAGRGQ